ncbi:MAG: hypothetical protein MUQ25_04295 [Candidatus Aminicenantes bacterium]|nr:hypothetical protein [Candidatus Aminicenantes bacterium]
MRLVVNFMLLAFVLSLPLGAAEDTKFTIDVSGFFLTRGAGPTAPLVSLIDNAGTGDIFTTNSVALNTWKPGGDLRLGCLWSKFGAEVRGFLLAKWSKSATYTQTVSSLLAIETDPFTSYGLWPGETLTANNESILKGLEANLTYDLTPTVRLYGGIRYLRINERFNLLGVFGGGNTELDVWNTTNSMLGGQIGTRIEFLRLDDAAARGFTVQGHGAFALFHNNAHADFTVVDYYGLITADANKVSPAVEAGLQVGYRLGRMIELHAGYDLIWLSSVAQAIRHVAAMTPYLSSPPLSLVFDSLVIHGAKAGVTIRF